MSYLGLNLDSLVWEIKALMNNNYGEEPTNKNKTRLFNLAKKDILETFKEIIEENKEIVFKEMKGGNQ